MRENTTKVNLTDWFDEIDQGILPVATKTMGWLKIAFCYSFFYLKEGQKEKPSDELYLSCLSKMLLKGGDTDTNAAIVGGKIGALVGFNNLPKDLVSKLLEFDCVDENGEKIRKCNDREKYLVPKHNLCGLLTDVFHNSPSTLKVQFNQTLIEDR